MKNTLKSIGLYIGFLVTVFLVLCFIFKDNKKPQDDCMLKTSEFKASSFIGHKAIDLIHCKNRTKDTFSFYYDDGESYVHIPYYDRDIIHADEKIIIEYELSDYDEDEDPTTRHYIFRIVDTDDQRATKYSGIDP